jgi:DNA excision repair protein ERCC-1
MGDDLFDGDDDLFASLTASEAAPKRIEQPKPQKIQQPTPQRLDKVPPASSAPKVVQPTPQALTKPSGGSAVLVSPRQRGNPVLASLRSIPWEYSDIPADYGLGLTTGALFLRYATSFPALDTHGIAVDRSHTV